VRHITAFALATVALSCSGSKYDYAGFQTHKYFPLDGESRQWTYLNENLDYLLQVDMLSPKEQDGSISIATLEYSRKDPTQLLWTVKWSSNSTDGIQIHGYLLEDTGDDGGSGGGDDTGGAGGDDTGDTTDVTAETGTWVSFSPPIQFSEYQMAPGDSVESTTGGVTYKSTLISQEKCPNNWVADPWDCLVFTLEGDDDLPFVGTWWLATDWGVSRFQPASMADGEPWVLTKAEWIEE